MSKEQDDRIIGTMHASLRAYTEHDYPVTCQEEENDGLMVRMYAITSPLTGTLYVSRLSDHSGNHIFRMDHEEMMTPTDLIRNYQEDFESMYGLAATYYIRHGIAQAVSNTVN